MGDRSLARKCYVGKGGESMKGAELALEWLHERKVLSDCRDGAVT
jgi:hypothetical protein